MWNKDAEDYVDFILDQPNWREIHRVFKTSPKAYDEITMLSWLEELSEEDQRIFEPVRALVFEKYGNGNLGIVLEKVKQRLLRLKLV